MPRCSSSPTTPWPGGSWYAAVVSPAACSRSPTGRPCRQSRYDGVSAERTGSAAVEAAGLSDYDIRRPMAPTGTNMLGLVKHCAAVECQDFGEVMGALRRHDRGTSPGCIRHRALVARGRQPPHPVHAARAHDRGNARHAGDADKFVGVRGPPHVALRPVCLQPSSGESHGYCVTVKP